MKCNKVLIALFILPFFSFSVHKYYLSLTQIEYVKEKKSVQIILRIFLDDLELAINNEYHIDAQITTQKEIANLDTYYKKYLKQHLKIKIDNQANNFNYIGKEYEGDVVYFYLEINNISKISSIEIINTLLTHEFPNQQNLIKAKANGTDRSALLTQEDDKGLLKF